MKCQVNMDHFSKQWDISDSEGYMLFDFEMHGHLQSLDLTPLKAL